MNYPSDEYGNPHYVGQESSLNSQPEFQGPDDRNSEISVPEQRTEVPNPQPQYAQEQNKIMYTMHPIFPEKFYEKIKRNTIYTYRYDYYANMIPLGSFCFAISFIVYGFYRCKVYKDNETFLWSMILLFGGVGQCTAGFLEFIKGRTFPAACYLLYGGYCISHTAYYLIPKIITDGEMVYPIDSPSVCAYYSAWVVIGFAILIGSVKVNLWYLLQCLLTLVFFLLRAIGEGSESLGTKRNAAGIVQVVAGFFSLMVFITQVLNNETFHKQVIPAVSLSPYNGIDTYRVVPLK